MATSELTAPGTEDDDPLAVAAAWRERVWAALNDPEVLKQCIPGCQSID